MYWIYDRIRGTVRLEIKGPQPEKLLNKCAEIGIQFWDCIPIDCITMRMTVYENDLANTERFADKTMCEITKLKESGGKLLRKKIFRRKALLLCIILLPLVFIWSSLRIWRIDVSGNDTVSTGSILRALENNGFHIGVFWPGLDTDMIRTAALPQLPELSWMTVNIRSSVAEVKVRERVNKPEMVDEDIPANIIASRTGIITKMSVLQGIAVKEPGNAVTQGEIIVSGAMDSIANGIRTVHAMADVEAHTLYEMTAVCPDTQNRKKKTGGRYCRYALVIGENRINFYRSSRKSRTDCDKIVKSKTLAVDGVFTLPVTMIKETCTAYETEQCLTAPENRLKDDLMAELKKKLETGGKVLSHTFSVSRDNGLVTVTLRAECLENISETVSMTQKQIDDINFANLNPKKEEN